MDATKSTRERYEQHASDDACRGCHERIDPIGFGFERFDAVGRYREMDGVHPIDERGVIVGLGAGAGGDVAFEGPRGLAAVLGESGVVGRCEVVQRARFSLGREPSACQVSRLRDAQVARGGRLVDAILALVEDVGFRVRVGGEAERDTPAVGAWDFDQVVTDPIGPIGPGEDPVGQGEVTWERVETSRWQTGYCVQVDVRNASQAAVSWAIVMDVEGVIANLWNAQASEVSGRSQRFVGVEWNATLGASQSTNFGYCANL